MAGGLPPATINGVVLAARKLVLTLRRVDADLVDRAAARAGCSVNIWLRGLIEARLADERSLERDLARIDAALAKGHGGRR